VTVVEDQTQRREEGEDKLLGPSHLGHACAAILLLVRGDVADPEPREKGVDQVVWADAPESLPLVDPEACEPIEPRHADSVGQVNRRSLSPSVSSRGSTSGASAAVSVEKDVREESERGTSMEKGGRAEVFRDGSKEFICVSISEHVNSCKGQSSEAQTSMPGQRLAGASCTEMGEESDVSLSYTGPNNAMQLVPRGLGRQLEEKARTTKVTQREESPIVEVTRDEGPDTAGVVLDREGLELARIKRFCSSILKTLAPPLLSEFERASGLRADAEPFTPKRVTRRSVAERAGTQAKIASAAESTFLKALGFCPENLAVSDDDLRRFKEFFDSPVRDEQLRVLAAIFGKELPTSFEREEHCMRVVAAH
jgi:hypothetical protein